MCCTTTTGQLKEPCKRKNPSALGLYPRLLDYETFSLLPCLPPAACGDEDLNFTNCRSSLSIWSRFLNKFNLVPGKNEDNQLIAQGKNLLSKKMTSQRKSTPTNFLAKRKKSSIVNFLITLCDRSGKSGFVVWTETQFSSLNKFCKILTSVPCCSETLKLIKMLEPGSTFKIL